MIMVNWRRHKQICLRLVGKVYLNQLRADTRKEEGENTGGGGRGGGTGGGSVDLHRNDRQQPTTSP